MTWAGSSNKDQTEFLSSTDGLEDAKVSPETMHQKYPQIIWLVFNKSLVHVGPHPISRVENNKYVRPPSTHWLQPLYPLIFPASPMVWLRNSKWLQTSPHLFSAIWIPYRSLTVYIRLLLE
jgi:hypothetical protein